MSDIINSSLKDTVKSTTLVFLGMVASILLWFVSKILIVRNITKEDLGLYSLVVAVAGIVSIFSTLGLQEGLSRYISVYNGQGKKAESESVALAGIKIGIMSGVCFSALLFLGSGVMARYVFYKPELKVPLMVISFFVLFSTAANIMIGILRGHNMVTPKVYFNDVGQPFFFLVLISLFFLLGLPFISIVYAYTAAMLLVLIFITINYYLKAELPLSLKGGRHAKELIRFSAPLFVASMLGITLTWCDTIMLGRYTVASEVGIYNVSASLAKLLMFPLAALEFVYMPIAGEMYAKRQMPELNKTYQILTKWNFTVTLPIFFILFFFPETTLSFLFSERFVESSVSLQILSVCFLFHAFLGANGVLMIIMGRSRDLMNISVFGALLNILLNYVLIKLCGYGAVGASVATLISYFALNIVISLVLYKLSGIHPMTAVYIKPVIGSAIAALIIYGLAKSLPLYFWMLPVYLLFFAVGYVYALVVTKSIEKEDIFIFDAIANRTGFRMDRVRSFLHRAAKI